MIALAVAAALLVAALCVALPLAVYATTLAAFGLPHVLAELRYVARRFGGRWPRRAVAATLALLAAIVALRVAALTEALPAAFTRPVELALVAALAALTLPALWRRAPARALLGGALIAAVAGGAAAAPITTAVILAGLHNLTPLGFIAEAAPDRRRALALAALAFVALPLLIASGLPYAALAALGSLAPEWSPLPAGPLAAHLGVYLPAAAHAEPWALHAFSAFVFLQCAHYAAVLHALPRLAGDPRPARLRLGAALALIGALTLAAFARDFTASRALYGVIAAVHAWIEVPVLLAALLAHPRISRSASHPSPNDTAFAHADSPIARPHGSGASAR